MATATKKNSDSATREAARIAHEALDRLVEQVEPREEALRDKARDSIDELEDRAAAARDRASHAANRAEGYVREHPVATAGIAFAAGMILSAFLRR